MVELRRTLLVPLDDLLRVTREFIHPDVSRSGLDRCLRRHGLGNLRKLRGDGDVARGHKPFKTYEPGFLHMDLKYLPRMADEKRRRYLFVAIDRATRWVYVEVKGDKTARSARAFLKGLQKACPLKITRILTDNGKEFTDRLFASNARKPTGNHEFDRLCTTLGIEHRLTRPRHPQTNGMVERFNGRNRGCSAHPSVQFSRLSGKDAASLLLALQPPVSSSRARYQNPDRIHESLTMPGFHGF